MKNRTDNTRDEEVWTKTAFLYFYPLIWLLGTLGNILKFIVFSRKKFKQNFFYLFRYLSIINTYVLLYVIIDFMSYAFDLNLEDVSYPFCKSVLFLVYAMGGGSGWFLVLISLDRTIYIFNLNNKFITLITKSYNLLSTIIIVFNLIYYMPMIMSKEYDLIVIDNSTSYFKCNFNDSKSIVHWMDIFNSSLIPFAIMILLTSFTLIRLNKIRSKTNLNLFHNQSINQRAKNGNNNSSSRSKDLKFAFTSIILNLSFLILNLPIALYLLISPYLKLTDTSTDDMLYVITSFFYYSNFGINFYINLFVNSLFRNEFLVMVKNLNEKFFRKKYHP